MKRFLGWLLLSASVASAEEAKLPHNTVMHAGTGLVTLKAGTVVTIVEQGDKTVTIKAAGKVGTIPWSALDDAEMMKASPPPKAPPVPTSPAVAKASPGANSAAAPAVAPTPRPAQSMYGKMVEKAQANAASHEKTLVKPTDEILDGN